MGIKGRLSTMAYLDYFNHRRPIPQAKQSDTWSLCTVEIKRKLSRTYLRCSGSTLAERGLGRFSGFARAIYPR